MFRKITKAISSRQREQAVARYMQEVRDIQAARLTRRDLLRMGLTAGVGGLVATGGRSFLPNLAFADDVAPALISPPMTNPWTNPLPIPKACKPVSAMAGPAPTKGQCPTPHRIFNEGHNRVEDFFEARSEEHERWDEFATGQTSGWTLVNPQSPAYDTPAGNVLYELDTKEIQWNFYSDAGGSPGTASVWTFFDRNSDAIGVLRINAQYGRPVLMRMYNCMPDNNKGICGINQQTTHLHNAHNPPESDGGPLRFFDSSWFFDYWYPNIRAGFATTHKGGSAFTGPDGRTRWCPGDYRETLSTLWFHDHRMDFTAQNVYRGLASFYCLFSNDINLDTSVESRNPARRGLGLPAGEYDIPLLFTDKSFDAAGEMFFDLNNRDGMIGDMQTVNFKIKPYLNVKRRKYRFRLLDAGPSRFLQLRFIDGAGRRVPFLRLSTDGNLLPRALRQTDARLGVAERCDIVIDFSTYQPGDVIYLHNVLEQTGAERISGKLLPPSEQTRLLKIIVTDAPFTDFTHSMNRLATQNMLPLPDRSTPVAVRRTFSFGTSNGQWTVNGNLFDPSVISAYPVEGTAEEWTLRSGGGWSHPVHIHHGEFQLTSRNGKPEDVQREEIARKDVVRIGDGAFGTNNGGEVTLYMRFGDWTGDYPMHCHNVVHEDHAMMIRFKVVPPNDPNAGR